MLSLSTGSLQIGDETVDKYFLLCWVDETLGQPLSARVRLLNRLLEQFAPYPVALTL